MRALRGVSLHETFFQHDLHDFLHAGVDHRSAFIDGGEDITDGGFAPVPKNGEKLQFPFSRLRKFL